MKQRKRRIIGALLSACMVLTTAAVSYVPSYNNSIVYAAEGYPIKNYISKDSSWYSSSDAINVAEEVIRYQRSDGGWRKDMTNTSITGSWEKSTIDNDATWGQIRLLAKVYNATGTEKYKSACLKGIDLLINGQYSNGGWPQVFNDPGTYHAHITFNDGAMVAVMRILQEVSTKSGDFAFVDSTYQNRAKTAVEKGVECLLKLQIKVNGTLTAWCQQHDENTLAPAGARAYELPSICTSESVGIVDFLRDYPNKDSRIIASVNAAVKWFESVALKGIKFVTQGDDKVVVQDSSAPDLWARFYDLTYSKPMFADRDGKAYSDVSQISKERRTGYSWYGTWPAKTIQKGLLSESSSGTTTEPVEQEGTHIYVGYSAKSPNYKTVQEAVNAAAVINPQSEQQRVNIHIAPGTYREQIIVKTPYISFINDEPSKEVKLSWYYGIGYKYYSAKDGYYDAASAQSKTVKGEAQRWGCATGLKSSAKFFRAEYITFENSFNRYVTDEELADGVEVSGSESITFVRYKGADVTSKSSTERACAIAVEGEKSEFYKCTFLGGQDTLYTGATAYFNNCLIEGNTDYIFGKGTNIFDCCELKFRGYSDKATGGYITAAKSDGRYLFSGCSVTANGGLQVGSGYFGRPWGAEADVAFVNTKLQYESLITGAGWTSMSGNAPENARFKEYNTTVNGNAVATWSRVSGTVKSSASGLDINTYLAGWIPYYYNYVPGQPHDPSTPTTPQFDSNTKYMLKNVSSGLYLDVEGGVAANGTNIQQWGASEAAAQNTFRLVETSDGYYNIYSCVGDGVSFVLDIAAKKTADGTNITLYTPNGGDNQKFSLSKNADGSYKLLTKITGGRSAVEVANASSSAGANVQQWSVNGVNCQDWILEAVEEAVATEAVTNGSTTEETTEPTLPPEPENILGDVNGDRMFDLSDLVTLSKWLAKTGEITISENADLNGDDKINVIDLIIAKRIISGK